MSTESDIVAAIDAAILAQVSGPGEITTPTGGTIKYRSLEDLKVARAYYAGLITSAANTPTARLRISRINSGGTV